MALQTVPRVRVNARAGRGFQAVWNDPLTGKRKNQMLRATRRNEAESEAREIERQLAEQGSGCKSASWDDAMDAAQTYWLSSRSESYQYLMRSVRSWFERLIGHPVDVNAITNDVIERVRLGLSKEPGISDATRHTYMKHLRALLLWCKRQGYMRRVPEFRFDRQGVQAAVRGRPVKKDEYERALAACPDDCWRRLITAMWLGGLRLNEALTLSWSQGPFQVNLDHPSGPVFVILAEGQKARRDEIAPMTPDMAEWLASLAAPQDRHGSVCRIRCEKDWAGKQVAKILRAAGVEATAHDLRRSFGTRWAMQVRPAVLQRLMRHASYATTNSYYVSLDAGDIWAQISGLRTS